MKTTKISPHKSSIGVDANWMSLIILGGEILIGCIPYGRYISWAVPLAFYIIEKKSKFVKFQAATLLVLEIIDAAIYIVFRVIAHLMYPRTWAGAWRYYYGGWGSYGFLYTLEVLFYIFFLVLAIIFVVNAVRWKQAEVPIIGPLASKICGQLNSGSAKPQRKIRASNPKAQKHAKEANKKTNTDAVMSVGSFVAATILMSLPLIGLVLAIIWAFVSCDNQNKRNYARAYLIFLVIGIVLSLIIFIASSVFMAGSGGFMGLFENFDQL